MKFAKIYFLFSFFLLNCSSYIQSTVPKNGADLVIDNTCLELFGFNFKEILNVSISNWIENGYSNLRVIEDSNYQLRNNRVIQCHSGKGPPGVGSETRIDIYQDNFSTGKAELYNVLSHEIGHMYGLNHVNQENNCMAKKISRNTFCFN